MSDQKSELPVILVVDDSKVIRRTAIKMLGDGYEVLEAVDGSDAWDLLQENSAISVVFTDLAMPVLDGIALLENIRSSDDEHISGLPVIIMTGHGDSEEIKQEVFDKGATDFIAKPFESIDLLTRAKSYAKLSRKVVELEKQAVHDKLTGLYNLSSFVDSGEKALSFAQRHKLKISTTTLEIEDFQKTYLKYGKNIAQQILINVSKRLQQTMRSEDIAARIGVAKFSLLLPMTSQINARVVVGRVREAINKLVFDIGKEKIRVSVSVGCTSYQHDSDITFKEMMEQAENALARAAKIDSGDKVVCFVEEKKPEKPTKEPSNEEIQQALDSIMKGDFIQIDEATRQYIAERLKPFINYMNG